MLTKIEKTIIELNKGPSLKNQIRPLNVP